ncbi:MAG: glycosyltransferase family 39 protein [bacterium]
MSTEKKLLIIFLIGLAVRSGLLIRHHHTYYLSGLTKGLLARNILEGRGLVVGEKEMKFLGELQYKRNKLVDISEIPVFENDNYFSYIDDMPGHGILLAGIWKITQDYLYIYIQILQIIIDTLMIFLIFSICKSIFNEKIATLGSFLYAIYFPQAFVSVHPLRDCWVMFVAIAIVYLIIHYYKKPNIVNALSIGLLAGLGTYMRPNLILMGLVCSIFALFFLGKRNCLKLILLGSLVFAAIMSPWWIRNWKIYHRFVPLSANFGHVMWVGLGVIPNEYGFVHSDEAAADYVASAGYDSRYITP